MVTSILKFESLNNKVVDNNSDIEKSSKRDSSNNNSNGRGKRSRWKLLKSNSRNLAKSKKRLEMALQDLNQII